MADRDLALLHHLEQRGLHLRGRAVDLVREQEVAEHRAELGVEAAGVRPVDARADEVRGHEVGRELQALERAAEHVGDGLDGQRLGQARDALEQHVAAGQQRDEHALEHRLLADDHPLDLEQRRLERVVRRHATGSALASRSERVEPPVLWGHVLSPGSWCRRLIRRAGCLRPGAEIHGEGTPVAAALDRHFGLFPGLACGNRGRDVLGGLRSCGRRSAMILSPVLQAGLLRPGRPATTLPTTRAGAVLRRRRCATPR